MTNLVRNLKQNLTLLPMNFLKVLDFFHGDFAYTEYSFFLLQIAIKPFITNTMITGTQSLSSDQALQSETLPLDQRRTR